MSLIDFILNVVALLLWFNWRALRFDPLVRTSVSSLAGTLRLAEPRRLKGWKLLAGLGVLLLLRAMIYHEIGDAANWTPKLDLGVVVIPFPGNQPAVVLLYSILAFVRVLIIFYFWLMVVSLLNSGPAENEPVQKMIRLHVGRLGHWPWPVQLAVPLFVVAALWIGLSPLLVYCGVINRASILMHLIGQGFLVGTALFFSVKHLFLAFLVLHIIISYVYVGASPFWDFVSATTRSLLAPLGRFRLRSARVDFAPAVGLILVVLLLYWLPRLALAELSRRNLGLWPQ